jgi:hypothetical protein
MTVISLKVEKTEFESFERLWARNAFHVRILMCAVVHVWWTAGSHPKQTKKNTFFFAVLTTTTN